jgi:hypothetical protein
MGMREQERLRVDARRRAEPIATAVDEQCPAAVRDKENAVPTVVAGTCLDLSAGAEEGQLHRSPRESP